MEATALPTEPQPLPSDEVFYNVALVGCTIRTDYKRGSNQILQLKTPTNENVRFDFEDISKKNRKLNLVGVANLYLKQVLFSFCR